MKSLKHKLKKRNKKAWVKMIEVFLAMMLLTASIALVVSRNYFRGEKEPDIENQMDYMIKMVETEESMRNEILNANLPVEWSEFETTLPLTYSEIQSNTPGYLICEAMVCELSDGCLNSNSPDNKNVYSLRSYISADLDTYSPRQLKLFCWRREVS